MKFKVGDNVKVINIPKQVNEEMLNCIGEILDISGIFFPAIRVKIPNRNFHHFDAWFAEDDLQIANQRRNK